MDIREAVSQVTGFKSLTEKEAYGVFVDIMSGKTTEAQIAAFITALKMKGETVEEITGAARAMRDKAVKLDPGSGVVLDTCGTGGSGTDTFNISTTVAFVIAGCGVKVAKHGNRSVSGRCGSADVLEKLGVKLDISVKMAERSLKRAGIAFLFAPLYHRAMKYAMGPRREIGIRTVFNMLGPLCNPAAASCQLLGVFDPELTMTMAEVLRKLGSKRAFVVSGAGPLDECSIIGRTKISELKNGRIKTYHLNPGDFGLKKATLEEIAGRTPRKNAAMTRKILIGEKGAKRDIVLMNAGLGLMAAGMAGSVMEGVDIAASSIDSGRAYVALEELINITNGR